uniref:alpha-glucan, water dikinase n=1 Tax=Noccaea caerulescens TaxID=107243 RepID=A0A1J3IBP2_NOCCA
MSNSVVHNLLNRGLIRPVSFEHQNKLTSSCAPAVSVYQTATVNPALGKIGRSNLGTKLYGKGLRKAGRSLITETGRPASFVPRAVLAMDPASQAAEKYNLDGNIDLLVEVTSTSVREVNIQIAHTSDSLLLHWGAIRDNKEKWVLPSRCPDRTINYKNRALRTPFVKSGGNSNLKLEIDDHAIQAIEFLIFDESRNKWYKNNGQNFHINLPMERNVEHNVSVPEDLVQIQAYIRWERNGKQNYSPEKEKEEYEAARMELREEMMRGASVEDLRAKLLKKDNVSDSPKTNGTSSSERKTIAKGDVQKKVPKQLKQKQYFRTEKIQRKGRDLNKLISKHVADFVEPKSKSSTEPRALKALEIYAKAKEEEETTPVFSKKIFKLDGSEILVLVTKLSGKTKIHLATDFKEPLTLHWALSQKGGEWLDPPSDILPPNSLPVRGAVDTQLNIASKDLPSPVQTFELEIEGDSYKGMPFVLNSGERWFKNNNSDFYVDFGQEEKHVQKDYGDGKGTAKLLLDKIADLESEAQKSFMHRFNIAADLVDEAKSAGQLGFAGILVWMRFMATRQLVWNKNYNVKPREISQAQDRLTDSLQEVYASYPEYRELLRMIMSTVGRGGEGDVGQRIRDEILVIQRKNDCKGGMMEEWHQKLHNNTSPDDVVICQALMDYVKSDFDMSVYWKTLNDNGINKERLLSYDRAIHSEPSFRREQKDGLLRDLGHYMRTLKAVHSGADLESAIQNCMGYQDDGEGFMVGVQINPISGLPSGYPDLLRFVLEHVEERNVEPLLEGLLEARQELRPLLLKSHDRLKDLLFLDLALDSTVRTAIERGYEQLNDAGPEKIMYFISLVLENLALSSDDNEDLIYCLKGWHFALDMFKSKKDHWALYAKSVLDRTRLALASKAERYLEILQPSAEYLGSCLGVDQSALNIFTEEIIRAGSAAALSSLVNRLDPVLRKTANLGSWQVISPVEVVGYVIVVDELLTVQNKTYDRPTIIVANRVRGEEEIPDGAVAVLTPDMPDVLSHVSVRARNGKICFATCFDSGILSDLQAMDGKLLSLQPTSADVVYREVNDSELSSISSDNLEDVPSISLAKKEFAGRYAISSEEFTTDLVGAKSRNIGYLKGKVPSWVGIPTSVALPFGVFEKVISEKANQAVSEKLQVLKKSLDEGDQGALGEIRKTLLGLVAPAELVEELKSTMKSSDMPWPGDEGEQRWEQAWAAIKKVWASKWNERAYFSTKKVKLDHDYLCMAVLVQEVINADYAFVIHTTNPSSGDSSEIYAEVVKGLGETLVGAYPGRSLSFISKKNNLDLPLVLGYPSKPIGLFIRRSIIFRSDSNGEDLEGYAGAGLYDSVPMDEEDKVVLDYTTDPLITDQSFQKKILSDIARAGDAIEKLYGTPQDIEGVIRDGKLYVVQTRPQV